MNFRNLAVSCTAAGLLGIAGCSSGHLVYVQETSLGINVGVGADGVQKMSLGYDRDIFALVPKVKSEGDAMSLFSVNKASISGLNEVCVSEFVASGKPAESLAERDDAVRLIRDKIYGDQTGSTCTGSKQAGAAP